MNESTLPAGMDIRPGDEVKHQILVAILDDDTMQWLEYMARDAGHRSGVDWSEGEICRRILNAARLAYVADMLERPRSRSLSAASFLNYLEARNMDCRAIISTRDEPATQGREGGEDSQPAK